MTLFGLFTKRLISPNPIQRHRGLTLCRFRSLRAANDRVSNGGQINISGQSVRAMSPAVFSPERPFRIVHSVPYTSFMIIY